MSRRMKHIADHKDFEAVLNQFYELGQSGSVSAEYKVAAKIDQIAGDISNTPRMLHIVDQMTRAVHSFYPLSDDLRLAIDQKHEANVINILSEFVDHSSGDPFTIDELRTRLQSAKKHLGNGASQTLPLALDTPLGPEFGKLQAFWSENSRYLNPVVLVSETTRLSRSGAFEKSDVQSSLIGLEAFRQIGLPLIINIPQDFIQCLGSDGINENGRSDFARMLVVVYENARLLIARIIAFGPKGHEGTGNAFVVFTQTD